MKDRKNVTEVESSTMFGKGLAGVFSIASNLRSSAILHIAKRLNNPNNTFAKTILGKNIKSIADVGAHVEGAKIGVDFVTSLAEKIDRFLALAEEVEEPAVTEEPAVEAFAVTEPTENTEDADDEETDDKLPAGLVSMNLDYIDVMENPEAYQEMLAREARGEITIVSRYRRSFSSRLVQSQGNVQEHYNAIKNRLLSYKDVKGRVSWDAETFSKGRRQIAKLVAKSKTLCVYLAVDPKSLEETTGYEIVDVSDKKKYAAVPTLIKVRGDRKFKFVMDLIQKICEDDLKLPAAKGFEEKDYRVPFSSTEDFVKDGLVKKLVAAIPTKQA